MRLQIHNRRERWIVGLADALLTVLTAPGRLIRAHRHERGPRRILLLRLER
ncbi:MAG: hypothetical protein HY654_01405, partial [Acidobacteria bacterium]|nr:hypothetical protein [Acidobacteriota bacterium]